MNAFQPRLGVERGVENQMPRFVKRQRDDAASKGHLGGQKLFGGLLDRLDDHAS